MESISAPMGQFGSPPEADISQDWIPRQENSTTGTCPDRSSRAPGRKPRSTEYPYCVWVAKFDTLGLGKDFVISPATPPISLLMSDPKTEKFPVFRLPYPMPFFTRGLDGRIDDPRTGWKGRGIWA